MTNPGELILIIEDERDIARMVEYNLKKEGYRTASAADGSPHTRSTCLKAVAGTDLDQGDSGGDHRVDSCSEAGVDTSRERKHGDAESCAATSTVPVRETLPPAGEKSRALSSRLVTACSSSGAFSGAQTLESQAWQLEIGGKTRMTRPEETLAATGYPPGGVCPFDTRYVAQPRIVTGSTGLYVLYDTERRVGAAAVGQGGGDRVQGARREERVGVQEEQRIAATVAVEVGPVEQRVFVRPIRPAR